MGRKSRFERRSKGSSYNPQSLDHLPKRGRGRTPSPPPERRRDESPYPRGPRQAIPEATTSRNLSPSRGLGYGSSAGFYEARPTSTYTKDIPSSPRGRIEDSRPSVEDYRRGGRPISADRIQNFHHPPRSPRSPSPSSYREVSKHKKSKNKKSRHEKKEKHREREKIKKSSHRQHDIWKPHNANGSPPASRGRLESSPRRSRSPSPRRDRVTISGSGREYYNNPPSSQGHERHGTWPPPTTQPPPVRSPAHRHPSDERELYQKHPPAEYDRPTSSSHGVHLQSPIPRRYEDYPPTYPSQDYERRDYDPYKQGRSIRSRGQDYNREDWEDAHISRERYETQLTESRYYSNYPEQSRPTYEPHEKYPTDPRYPETRVLEAVPRRRTPEAPRAQYEHQYRQPRYPYGIRGDPYEHPPYPSREENIKSHSSPSYPSQYHDTRYDDGYADRFPESTRIIPPPTLSQETIPPRTTFAPLPPQEPNGFHPIDHHPPSVSNNTISAPSAPKPHGGIKPFTLKSNVLKNLKRARESDLESERIFKSSRTSPRHGNATLPGNMPPLPTSANEIQQTQTPETPSNRDKAPEQRVSTKEKGASMFERIGQVGEGTYGKVYKARNTLTGELVALKKIRMEAERDGFPITAMREIKLLESLRHPNVIHLQEMMFEKTFVYMVFEYMDHDLAGILTHPHFTFTPAQIKELLRQMLEGLHYLHRRGILHRDIKGSNILLSASGQLKLADFGLARHYHKRRDNLDYTNRVITLWYRPPELLLGATAYGPAVDVWSIGCIMLEMFTKKALFPGADELDQLRRIWNIMGTPTMETWPKVTELPWWELVKPHPAKVETFHADFDGILSKQAINLASKLLSLDPEQRPTAFGALQHPYFTKELPRPERPHGLDKMDGEWHEFESKQRKRAQKALQQQESRQTSPKHQ